MPPSFNRQTVIRLSLIAGVLFAVLTLFVHFTLQVDDFEFLAHSLQRGGLKLIDFKAYLAPRPVYALLNYVTYKMGLFRPNLLIPIYFFGYSLSFGLLCFWLLKKVEWLEEPKGKRQWRMVCAVLLILIFYPSHHELLYQTINMPYQLGLLFLVAALYTRGFLGKVLWLTLTFFTFETYILPAFLIPVLPWILNWKKPSRSEIVSALSPWFVAAILYQIIFRLDSPWLLFNSPERDFSALIGGLKLHQVLIQLDLLFKFVWEIQFYKTNYVATALEDIVWIGVTAFLLHQKKLSFLQVLGLFLLTFAAGAHYLLLGYYAPRAVFGAVIVKNMIFFVLLYAFLTRVKTQKFVQIAMLGLLFLAYSIQTSVVMKWKNHNHTVMVNTETDIRQKLQTCTTSPCQIDIQDLGAGLKYDWVLPPLFQPHYLEYLHLKYAPNQDVTFKIILSK